MKFTRLATALALAAIAAPSFAAIGNTDDTAELFAVLWDENVGSYTIDLGITLDTFAANGSTAGYSFSKSVLGANYSAFVSADTNPNDGTKFDGTRWAIFAADVQSFGDPGEADGYRYLTTFTGNTPKSIDNGTLQAGTNTVGGDIEGNINQSGGEVDVAVNKDYFNPVGSVAAFKELNNTFAQSAGVYAGNVPGAAAKLYYFYTGSYDFFGPSTRIDFTGTATFDGTSFSYSVPAVAVPEPGSIALMLAGLMAVGFVVRRRG